MLKESSRLKINLFVGVNHFTIIYLISHLISSFSGETTGCFSYRGEEAIINSSWTSYHMALWCLYMAPVENIKCVTSRSGPVCNSNGLQSPRWDASRNNAVKCTTWTIMPLKATVFSFCPKGRVLGGRHQARHRWQSAHFWKLHRGQRHGAESEHSVLPICGRFQYSWPWATVGAHQLHHKGTTWVHSRGALKSFLNGSYSWATSVSQATLCQLLHDRRSFLFRLCWLFSANLIWQESFPITSNNSRDKCVSQGDNMMKCTVICMCSTG